MYGFKKGDWVEFIVATDDQVKYGQGYDPRHYLKMNETYEVLKFKMYAWHSHVWLKDFPDVWFNSAHFRKVEK
jgi:hypothetical protein